MIVLGAVWPGRTSLGIFLLSPPCRQVSPFTSCVGGGRVVFNSSPPAVLRPPQEHLGLFVLMESVDAWL